MEGIVPQTLRRWAGGSVTPSRLKGTLTHALRRLTSIPPLRPPQRRPSDHCGDVTGDAPARWVADRCAIRRDRAITAWER